LNTIGHEVRVLNSKGRVVGMVGKQIRMAGGPVGDDAIKENGIVDQRTLSVLLYRCPAVYFLVQEEGTRVPRY
jgi:hypothetical protein